MTPQRDIPGRATTKVLGMLACAAMLLGAWGAAAAAGHVRVRLGYAKASPGDEVRVPLRLKASRGVPVGGVSATVRFDPTQLEFVAASAGESLIQLNGEVFAAERPLSATEAVLRMGAVTTDAAQFGKRLRNGVVAWLTFRVRTGARIGQLALEHEPQVARVGLPAVRVEHVQARPGRIRVTAK